MFNHRCYQGGKKHNFQPRFSEKAGPVQFERVKSFSVDDVDKLRSLTIFLIYEYDICVWCGKTIRNINPNEETLK